MMIHMTFILLLMGTVGYLLVDEEVILEKRKRYMIALGCLCLGGSGHWLAIEQFGYGSLYFLYMALGMLLILLAVSDYYTLELPLSLLMLGYAFSGSVLIYKSPENWGFQIVVAICVLGVMLVLSKLLRGGLGQGDAHVMALLILGLGWTHGLSVFMIALFLSAVTGIGLMIFAGKGKKTSLPFVPFIAAAHFGLLLL